VSVDLFLKIEGVSGESPDAKHKGEIQLESFSWFVSKASPKLMLACATGKHHKEAVLTVRKAGKSQQEYLIIKLEDVIITSYQIGGTDVGDAPMDQASLGFSTIQMEYKPQKADGSLDTPVTAGWDLKNNKAL
jgi:type VI secretion system secreted protein Hcp